MQNCKSCDDLFNKLFELVHKFLNMEAKFATLTSHIGSKVCKKIGAISQYEKLLRHGIR